jgi:hypothetical protein
VINPQIEAVPVATAQSQAVLKFLGIAKEHLAVMPAVDDMVTSSVGPLGAARNAGHEGRLDGVSTILQPWRLRQCGRRRCPSDCYRLERPLAGWELHPLKIDALSRHNVPVSSREGLPRLDAFQEFGNRLIVAEQHQTLVQKVRGHFVYYGITGNASALQVFRDAVERIWRKWLARRRRRGFLSWASFGRLLERFPLPAVVVVHSVYRR